MDDQRKARIASALQDYRDAVLELNLTALRYIVDALEEEPPPPDVSDDEVRDLQLQLLRDEYGIYLDSEESPATSIRDFLAEERRDRLIAACSLDGVSHGDRNSTGRKAWLESSSDEIESLEGLVAPPTDLPEDLKYLSTLAPGICGPGLPVYREINQLSFLTDMSLVSEHQERVDVPLSQQQLDNNEFNALSPSFEGWEISVGVRIGDGPRAWGGGFVVYCRLPDSDRKDWRWRYGMQDQTYSSELFDTVEEFLKFYATFNAQTEEYENIKIVPLEQIM